MLYEIIEIKMLELFYKNNKEITFVIFDLIKYNYLWDAK